MSTLRGIPVAVDASDNLYLWGKPLATLKAVAHIKGYWMPLSSKIPVPDEIEGSLYYVL